MSPRAVAAWSIVCELVALAVFVTWLWAVIDGRLEVLRSIAAAVAVSVALCGVVLWAAARRLPGDEDEDNVGDDAEATPTTPPEPARVGVRVRVVPRGALSYQVIDLHNGEVVDEFEDEKVAREFARGFGAALDGPAALERT